MLDARLPPAKTALLRVDLRVENAYCAVPLPRLSFAEIFPEEFRGYSA
jgi:hypothetical protein